MVSRRSFLATAGSSLILRSLYPLCAGAADSVPSVLDHILLGCSDLDRGIDFVFRQTGVRAAFGGVHPGAGTQNALISLGVRHYLEIIAPDPKQPGAGDIHGLKQLAEPRLAAWAAHPGDIQAFANRLTQQGIAFTGPLPGSRQRPDGRVLNWKIIALEDDASGLLPFFIEWGTDSVHPSIDAPAGCRLVRFEIGTRDPDSLSKRAAQLGLDILISEAPNRQLRATIAGPKGQLQLTS